ncbi:MAG TPA: phosphate ABC transporter permease subunit PstC [Panacibacter sp.]|nr:phosphate ABC transporter permease subunit PstC [Panacibacter sp.]HNP42753.1 phosphate ABC transporter permease subunit PstC [Panacibacter sp.]
MTKRKLADSLSSKWMLVCLSFFLLMPLAIGAGLVIKSSGLLSEHTLSSLILSSDWSPSDDQYGFWPFIVSSLWVTIIALIISMPLCLLAAIYLTQFSPSWVLKIMRPVIDILAGIPSVVYGVWGVLIIVPFVGDKVAPFFENESLGYSILAGALVLSVMSVPYILNMLLEVFRQVPVELGEASLSLGATKWETIKHVFIRKGATGILSAYGLGFSKALGETIAVMMVVGNVVQVPESVFDAGYPLPALVANNYGEMMSIPSYESALMFGSLLLFVIILAINIFFRYIIYKSEVI